MLLSFSVSNFRSIRDEATLSMFASRRIKEHPENTFALPGNDKIKLLRSMAIYGANASGKSNIFKALTTLFRLIEESAAFTIKDSPVLKSYDPFLLESTFLNKPTRFQLSFSCPNTIDIGQIIYEYSLEFNASEIIEESLYFNPKGQKAKLFHRLGKEVSFGEYFSKGSGLFKSILSDEQNLGKLLLSLLLTLQIEEFKPIQGFLLNQVWWNETSSDKIPPDEGRKNLASILGMPENKAILNKFTLLIKALDTGIGDIQFENKIELDHKGAVFSQDLYTYHKVGETKVDFGVGRESDGTRVLLSLGGYMILKLVQGGVLIVDEIDRSLPPKIVEYIFKIFNDPKLNTKNAQLIATTHSAMIMKNDIFRRDQILIAERGDDGASSYYTLADVQGLRAGVPFERYYYAGMVGGTPDINDVDFRAEFL